ncbi:MAG: GNAT family N-acetyltransferase [Acidobacteriota bacterium]|nr:GNAT family N-acetyltransferase [Acidobacteriota bacterium]
MSRDPYRFRDLALGDIGLLTRRHALIYAQEFGWDQSFEVAASRALCDFWENRDPKRQRAWIAERDDKVAGCIFLYRETDAMSRLRMLLVEPEARGSGLGGRLVEACMNFAREAGYRQMRLWTCNMLQGARRLYQRAGFRQTESETLHRFGVDMIGEIWVCDL